MQTRTQSSQRARYTVVGAAMAVVGFLVTAGCAQQQTQVSGTRQDGVPRKAYSRVLIVGVSPDVNQRCAFEFFMVSQLKSDAVQPIRSCDAVKEKVPLTLESIEQAVATYQADAVLATNLVSRSFKSQEGGSRDTRGTANYKAVDSGWATGYYGTYGVPVVYGEFATAPPVTVAEGQVQVESKFYATEGKTLLYTLDTKAGNLESTDTALHDVAAAIANQLRREGLTR